MPTTRASASARKPNTSRNGTAVVSASATKSATESAAVFPDSTYTSSQLRPLLAALHAAKEGDFSARLPTPKNGILSEIHRAFNDVIGLNQAMAEEIVRVGRIVGREGRMTERAKLKRAAGLWATSNDSINQLIEDLARPTTEVARVITAVAEGDLSQKMALEIEGTPVKGEFLRIGTTVNTMVDQLSSFAAEVTRVAKEVGTEGKLGGQAEVRGVSGTWKDLTDNVNGLAGNLTNQVRNIALVTTAVANGDLSQKITVDAKGEILELKNTINVMVDQLNSFAAEVTRVAREVGTEGKLGGQAEVRGVSGTWKDLTDNVNFMAGNLTTQVRGIVKVVTAVANGDLKQKLVVEAKGEVAALAETINNMTDTLSIFADQVNTVAREVGTEGILGGQAKVPNVAGTWKDLTDNVNFMASNLTTQVRGIAKVVTAVADGDLDQKLVVEAKGEVAALAETINSMTDTLSIFAEQVTTVAREVGTEGKLGGQADVPNAAGTWKDLTDNVNFMASNLTGQVRNIALVTTAVANGDLSQKITADVKGEMLELKNTINVMVDQLSSFAAEVTRVAKEVGTEGKLGGQAEVRDVSGTWKDLTDNVNGLAGNLTNQVRNIALVTTAVANGDLSQKITVDAQGEILELKDTINVMVDQLRSFAAEVTRVAREVGTEGKLGGQAEVEGVSGTWKDLTDNVNFMAGNLTTQVRGIVKVVTAVANGDLNQKLTVEAKGEVAALAETINNMTDTLSIFADQVNTVAREVGTEGILGGQAKVPNVAGTWKDLTDNVNFMASNLTTQVRGIAKVVTAVADGDLDQKLVVEAKGEVAALAETINSMTDTLSIFAEQVTTVAREVGTEGKLGGQADVPNAAGTWKDLTDNVNFMASNLTGQVRNIALVTTAVANGDLSQKITADAKGEILELKNTINVMVDQLSSFAAEVTRVAKEVGTEGKLGGQAEVEGVSGTWKDLTDNVNGLAGNLTNQVRNIALVTTAVANGDLSKKITVDVKGEMLELKNTVNLMVDQLNSFAAEVTRVAREVGTEGKLGGQAEVEGVSGTWKDLTDSVNFMAGNLTTQVRGIVKVVTAVANGDLNQKLMVEAKGEVAALAETINDMTDTLSIFAEQVTSVAREVGTEGILGGQAKVPNVAGTWKDLTENVNFMASNLTTQVRGIAKVVTAVANGDLNQKLVVDAKGEVAALAETINNMTDTLSIFAEQVITVAREVGAEGQLGGQAKVPNVAGTWKDLTDNVNFMANSLTTQVRAISDVATAVTEGDLTRSIDVEAQGEVDTLRNNINQMIANLKETTQKNEDQDFLKTNLARFSRMMQGQKSLESVADLIMSEVTPLVKANHGVFFISEGTGRDSSLQLISTYAYQERKGVPNRFGMGQGIVGQCALEKKTIIMEEVPTDYIRISSGLGAATPLNVIALPVLFEGEIMAVIELASFQTFSEIHRTFLDQMTESIGVVLNMIQANVRTEELLEQSQSLTQELQSQSQELQSQQDQLKQSNSELEAQAKELEEKASLLAVQNTRVEQKNREVELARAALEEKAEQLALSSKYKSEFLANMSHELRTPLNSMLILAKLLADNTEGNLTTKQVGFAQTVHGAGGDLLNLINEILDLSKVEAGKMEIEITDVPLLDVRDYVERSFAQQAEQKGLDFQVSIASNVPYTLQTDSGRLQQVLKNLLSNAFKFTESGSVELEISVADPSLAHLPNFRGDSPIIAFAVRDTGIGISRDKQKLIFEPFQQADGTTSRKYGGTGLGLSISKGITGLLGGRIQLQSEPGAGSTFTLFLPQEFSGDPDGGNVMDGDYLSGNGFNGFGGSGGGGSRGGSISANGAGVGTGAQNGSGVSNGTSAPRSPSSITAEATHIAPRFVDTQPSHAARPDGSAAPFAARPATTSMASTSAAAANLKAQALAAQRTHVAAQTFTDDRHNLEAGDRILLIIEDDVNFASILLDTGRRQGFKGIVALQGDLALAMAREYQPHAITLDLQLPLIDGWTVLDHLKRDPETRHIPVQVISIVDRDRGSLVQAISYLEKPVSREAIEGALAHMKSFSERDVRELLVVEDDDAQRESIAQLIDGLDVNITQAGNGEEALTQLKEKSFDCMILDLGLPDMGGFELLKKIKKQARYKDLPVVIYTGQDLSKQEETQLKKYAATIITKDATSAERLVDETAMFLHRIFKNIVPEVEETPFSMPASSDSQTTENEATTAPSAKPKHRRGAKVDADAGIGASAVPDSSSVAASSNGSGAHNDLLEGLKVLVVDDDSRNIFALTSVLENYGINVVYADNGRSGIETLQATPGIDLVLMDVMMPEMDGYETTQAIRALSGYKDLPIIALTAKAMAGDREKCLDAGASDYITKPVDIDALLTLMRQWSRR